MLHKFFSFAGFILLGILITLWCQDYIRTFVGQKEKLCVEKPSYPLYLVNWIEEGSFKIGNWADSVFTDEKINPRNNPIYVNARNGARIFRQTIGLSLIQIPALTLAHTWASRYDYSQDGISSPYVHMVFIWSVILLLIGCYWIYALLIYFVSRSVAFLSLLCMVSTTHFLDLFLVFDQFELTALFALHAGLIYYCVAFFYKPGYFTGFMLGLLAGLIALVRPVEILLVFAFFFSMIGFHLSHWRVKLNHLIRQYKFYLIALLVFLGLIYIQLSYWWFYSNKAFVFNDQVLGFDTNWNKFFDLIAGVDSGWAVYTPVLGLMALGFFMRKGQQSRMKLSLVFAIGLVFLSTAFLSFWWNDGDNHDRQVFHTYVFLMLPFAVLIQRLWSQPFAYTMLALVILSLSYINFWRFQDSLKSDSLWELENKSPEYLKASFLKDTVSEIQFKLLDLPLSLPLEVEMDTSWLSRNRMVCLNVKDQYIKRFSAEIDPSFGYFRFAASAMSESPEKDSWKFAQMIISFYRRGKNIDNEVLRVPRYLKPGIWKQVWIDAKTPPGADKIAISIWNADSNKELCFKEIRLYSFQHPYQKALAEDNTEIDLPKR